MPHVLVVGKIHDDGIALLRATSGITVDLIDDVTLEPHAEAIGHADALLLRTQPMRADIVRGAERLRIVSRHGVGYDAVDVEALTARRIPLAIIGDVNAVPVAEHAMMMMLALAKRTRFHDRSVRAGIWSVRNAFSATELDGKALLVVGYGRIGRRVAKLGKAFNMEVASYDPFVD
jgi:D-3-phosphoglycerate dehydrogenase